MIFRIGDKALYQDRYLCRIEENDHTSVPYFVRFLGREHPEDAVYLIVVNGWFTWCRPEDLSPAEDVEPLTVDINLSEVL